MPVGCSAVGHTAVEHTEAEYTAVDYIAECCSEQGIRLKGYADL